MRSACYERKKKLISGSDALGMTQRFISATQERFCAGDLKNEHDFIHRQRAVEAEMVPNYAQKKFPNVFYLLEPQT